jgi:hypothetical protein
MWVRSPASPARIPARPSPLQRDVGSSSSLDRGFWERGTPGGTQEVGGPRGASRKRAMTYVMVHFLSFSPPQNKLTQPVSLKRQVATKKKTATTTTAATTTTGTTTTTEQPPPRPTQRQQYSPTMSSAERRPNVDQRAQRQPNNQTYTSQRPNNDQRGQQPPRNQIHTTYPPSTTRTCHRQSAPAIDNLHQRLPYIV